MNLTEKDHCAVKHPSAEAFPWSTFLVLGAGDSVRAMRDRAGVVVVLLIVAVAVAGCGSARPQRRQTTPRFVPLHGVQIQLVLTGHGDPSLGANAFGLGPGPKFTWLVCQASAGACTPITRGTSGPVAQFLSPGRIPAGRVFEAAVHAKGLTYRARSSTWLGRTRPLTAARISGTAAVGAQVRPVAGGWSGGWSAARVHQPRGGSLLAGGGPDVDQLSIEACHTRVGQDCVNLSPQRHSCLYSPGPVRVPKQFVGWYLFAFDQRMSPGGLCAGVGYSRPEVEPTVRVGPLATRSRPIGPVRP
jgi:hypothetical protein